MTSSVVQTVKLIFDFLIFAVDIYNYVFFIWILSTWLPVNRSIIILRFVDNLINPVYNTLRRVLPPLRIGIMDFSPFYMSIFLMVVEFVLVMIRNYTLMALLRLGG